MRLPIRYNLRSVVQRKTRSLLTAGGIALAIFVSVLMIAMSRGLLASALNTASPDTVIVLSKGAESMEFSAIDPSDFHRLTSSEFVAQAGGRPVASPEAYLSTFVTFGSVGEEARRGVVRGVWSVALQAHPRVRVVEGSPPARGFGVAIGRLAAVKMGVPSAALAVGKTIEFEGQRWTVTGVFEAPGTTLESEIWADLDDVLTASKREDYSAVVLATPGPQATEDLLFDLTTRTDIRVEAKTEQEYYAAIASSLRPVQAVSVVMTAMLVFGAVMAGMNTMFTSILGRTREMGVLLVLGYKRKAVLLSFVVESLLLCLAGGLVGTAAGSLLNGLPMKIPMGAFRFAVDTTTLGIGVGLAALIGVLGAALPVLRVARLKTVEALRAN